MKRCSWVGASPLMQAYHDTEWGVPVHQDRKLFEALVLGGAQAGLSWEMVLKKREGYREAFQEFNPAAVALYRAEDVERLLAYSAIIRNRQKILSAVGNARRFLEVQQVFGSFDQYVWGFVGGVPVRNGFRTLSELPAKTEESERLSKDLLKRGFKFVGPTICYAFMQAVGMVNDHTVDCFRYQDLQPQA